MPCRLCRRAAEEGPLCRYHGAAFKELRSGYLRWCKAYGQMVWEDYLRRVLSLPETGLWVREVAELGFPEAGDMGGVEIGPKD